MKEPQAEGGLLREMGECSIKIGTYIIKSRISA
jgi:hypothetical protein